jgi:signal transduction histidine kinase
LEKFGLTAAIQDAIFKVGKSTDLFISTDMKNIDGMLSTHAEINVFRAVQEALSNIVKHATANAAKVSIQVAGKVIRVTVQDNGKGFDHEIAIAKSKSLGLRTLYERIASIGGKLKIEPGSPRGTIIEMRIPIS